MTKCQPDCIIFDMDDVLCRYDFPRRMQILAEELGVPATHIVDRVYSSGLDERADCGEFSAAEYMAALAVELGVEVPLDLWLRARRESICPDQQMLDLARRIGRRYKVAMLTNNGELLREHLSEVFPEVVEIFGERAFFSCQFGITKPRPEVFLSLLQRLGCEGEKVLMIDDTPQYVAGAREAGLQTHVFTGYEELPAWLRQMAEG